MHVAIAAHDFYPDPGSGGTGRYVYETARRLVDEGHHVSVLTRRRGDVPLRERVAGVHVYRYEVSIAGENAPAIARQLPEAYGTVRSHAKGITSQSHPDVVSFQGPFTSLLLDRALGEAPRVTTFHSPWPTEYVIKTRGGDMSTARRRINVETRRLIERRVLERSDGIVALSDYMRGELRDVYGDGFDAQVVPGGVDAEQFTADAGTYAPIAANEEGTAFLAVRRLSDRMGHDQMLAAFANVREAHPDTHLFVAGDGPLRRGLEARAESLGVADATTFLGYVPDADLPAAYATADAFVRPTQDLEGFGLATLEALASGTPVVATPVGGTVEVLAGLPDQLPADPLTTDASAGALAEGMDEWASLDDATLEDASETCRQYAREEFSWDDTVAELVETYRQYLH
jgi:glycosyltransferase involved in cell wall biosynthesis